MISIVRDASALTAESIIETAYQNIAATFRSSDITDANDFQQSFESFRSLVLEISETEDSEQIFKTLIYYFDEIIKFGNHPYASKFRGGQSTCSDRILKELIGEKVPIVSLQDDLESLVKSFILLFEGELCRKIGCKIYKHNLA
jgi:hypothetical protein